MKTVAIVSGIASVAFIAMAFQAGVFRPPGSTPRTTEASKVEEEPSPVSKPGPRFPEDLAPAAQAQPVPAAAEYRPTNDPHPMIFLRLNGSVHSWQEAVREDWAADSVGTTQLAVVVGNPKKIFVSHHDFGPAPPIDRFRFELEISVIEVKTGRILANRLFRNEPRGIMAREAWETTLIGRTVSMRQVFLWVQRNSKVGFPDGNSSEPVVSIAD